MQDTSEQHINNEKPSTRPLVASLLGGLALISLPILYAMYRMVSRPANTPARSKNLLSTGKKVVVCIGDSITQGSMSSNYVDRLNERLQSQGFHFVNAGVNGDLAYNSLQQLDEAIALQPSAVIVLIGSNDLLATLNTQSERMYMRSKKLPARPNKEWYRENLLQLVRRLKQETHARIALLSLPVIGEVLDAQTVQLTSDYSAVIREIAHEENVTYLPLHEEQVAYLHATTKTPAVLYKGNWSLPFVAGLKHYLLRQSWDEVAAANGLQLTTDTVHLNDRSARMITTLVEGFLLQPQS